MSVFNIKSKVIANRDAAPPVLTDAILATGDMLEVIGCERLPLSSDAGSTMRLVSVPSSARLSSLEYFNAQLGTSALDIAVWYPTVTPGALGVTQAALISSSAFAANIAGVDTGTVADGMGTITQQSVQRRCMPLWQSIGLASDPNINLDIGFTVRTANAVAGYAGLRARFVR